MKPSFRFGADGDSDPAVLWEHDECVFCAAWRELNDGERTPVLAVISASSHPSQSCLDRLANEYELKDELASAWALRPLELVRERDRTILLLENPGG